MEKKEKKKVYARVYDNPLHKDGSKKPNEYLGEFIIDKTYFEDSYSGKWLGHKEGKEGEKYMIEQFEVSGFYHKGMGGSRFEITKI